MRTSTSPVGRFGLTVSPSRITTLPSMRTTHSARTFSAAAKAGVARIDHALGEPVMVAQIDEQQPAMVAHAMHPARKRAPSCRHRPYAARRKSWCDRRVIALSAGSACRDAPPAPFFLPASAALDSAAPVLFFGNGGFRAPALSGFFHRSHPLEPSPPAADCLWRWQQKQLKEDTLTPPARVRREPVSRPKQRTDSTYLSRPRPFSRRRPTT